MCTMFRHKKTQAEDQSQTLTIVILGIKYARHRVTWTGITGKSKCTVPETVSFFPNPHKYLAIIQISPSPMSSNTVHVSLLTSSHMVYGAATLPGEGK